MMTKYKMVDFQFQNQGWGKISRSLLECAFAALPRSSCSSDYKHILKEYSVGPYRMSMSKRLEGGEVSIDQRRCYTSILQNMTTDWNCFGPFDHIMPVKVGDVASLPPGEYYVRRSFRMGRDSIHVSRGFYPLNLIKYAIKEGYISRRDITYGITASQAMPGFLKIS